MNLGHSDSRACTKSVTTLFYVSIIVIRAYPGLEETEVDVLGDLIKKKKKYMKTKFYPGP